MNTSAGRKAPTKRNVEDPGFSGLPAMAILYLSAAAPRKPSAAWQRGTSSVRRNSTCTC
jgi:hypothetical protein